MSLIATVVTAAVKTIVEHFDSNHGQGPHWTGGYLLGRFTSAFTGEIRRRQQSAEASETQRSSNVIPLRRPAGRLQIGRVPD